MTTHELFNELKESYGEQRAEYLINVLDNIKRFLEDDDCVVRMRKFLEDLEDDDYVLPMGFVIEIELEDGDLVEHHSMDCLPNSISRRCLQKATNVEGSEHEQRNTKAIDRGQRTDCDVDPSASPSGSGTRCAVAKAM